MKRREKTVDRRHLEDAFQGRELHGRQRDLIVVASLFATGGVVPDDRRLAEAYALPILDAMDWAGELFSSEILSSVALSEAEL